ncbi:MAG TPA: hypothetical protein VF635_05645 [Propionibacteriaceae bacterium]|jgi:hypothetical protein
MQQHLIQILLPLSDNEGAPFLRSEYLRVRSELTEQFGGLTAFTRGPAEGSWQEGGKTAHDDIVVFEVMTSEVDHKWWDRYRRSLEARFKQDCIIIRAQEVRLL